MEDVGFKLDLIDVENSERSQERALQVSRERLGDGVAILGGGREGEARTLFSAQQRVRVDKAGMKKLALSVSLDRWLSDHSNQLFHLQIAKSNRQQRQFSRRPMAFFKIKHNVENLERLRL